MLHELSDRRTEVLVLGTAHLTHQTPDSALRQTLSRLSAWQPDAIAVELLAGDLIQNYRLEGATYSDLRLGGFPTALKLEAAARKERSWTRAQAEDVALDSGTPAAERVLAWLTALEPASALLTWTRDLELPGEVTGAMTEYAAHQSEVHRIAVPLGRQLGRTRLHHFDDHTDTHIGEHMKAIHQFWETQACKDAVGQHPLMVNGPEILKRANAADDYWVYLRYVNSEQTVEESYDLEVGTYLRSPLPKGEHRSRVAQWDTRNLFMAARLRMVTAQHPGGRVLALVGHAHKGPLEKALLSTAPDLRMVSLSELEGTPPG